MRLAGRHEFEHGAATNLPDERRSLSWGWLRRDSLGGEVSRHPILDEGALEVRGLNHRVDVFIAKVLGLILTDQ